MAQVSYTVSDLSKSKGATTVQFGFGKAESFLSFEIDLTEKEFSEFAELFARYVKAGRQTKRIATQSANGDLDLSVIRAWAKARGVKVSDKGRVSEKIVQAFKVWTSANEKQSEAMARKADELLNAIRTTQAANETMAKSKDLPTPAVLAGVTK